uniref:RRM domain-containing protein n=1 Tax=Ciona intestinalis TaxID=7719 RepID=F6ZPC9_CIOIN
MALPSWSEYLNQQFENHVTEVKSCFLAQPCHDSSSIDQFYNSLKKGKKKHPVLVALYKVADGIILMFRNQQEAVQYIDKYSSNIDNRKKLKFFKRDIPKLCTDRLAIQNVGQNTCEDTLSLLLESYIETEPKQLTSCSKAGSYLAFYPPGIDVTTAASRMNGVVLEESKLKVGLIYPTNCILVSDIPPSTSEAEIARCFINFDQSLNITRIVRCSQTSAVVHFLQCNDAEMICVRFESGRLKTLHGDYK